MAVGKKRAVTSEKPSSGVVRTRRAVRARLIPTSVSGVFLDEMGRTVNADGVPRELKDVLTQDKEHWETVAGKPVTEPHELLKAMALDPTMSRNERKDAAKAAAQYYAPKLVAVQGGGAGAPPIAVALDGKSEAELRQERDELKALLRKLSGGAASV